MDKYSTGKIYRIWNTENDSFYIGSTVQPLFKRMHNHRTTCKRRETRLFKEIQRLGIDVFRIELVENYPCQSTAELNRREGELIRELKPNLNKNIAGRADSEYYFDNKEKYQAYQKQ